MRWVAAAAAAAAILPVAGASAAPQRTATTTKYTHTTFLQHALGLPASDTNPVIESVTYYRLQWQLRQAGNFAILIGDPATDPTFAARARDVEATAKAEGAKKIYWFNPNLSGSAVVGTITEPALDIRDKNSIPLVAASQTKYGNVWLNLIGQYLGNGYKATVNAPYAEAATVTATPDATVVNDAGGPNGVLYDYSSGSAPANVLHSFFFIYNKDNTIAGKAAKIVTWVDLTNQATSAATAAAVKTALTAGGTLSESSAFAWWQDEGGQQNATQAATTVRGKDVPFLTAADNADGWNIDQVTYPEIVDLLSSGAQDADAVILFGGLWCPNTRPITPALNKYAVQNNVRVFNYDTVLDGGVAGGGTTSSGNPLQTRNTSGSNAASTDRNNPTYLYGDLVDQYLTNIKTQYVTEGGNEPGNISPVTYYKGGGAATTTTKTRKLQVPFVISYAGKAGNDANPGVSGQWLIDDGDGTYTEYMSQWWWTTPQPNQLGISLLPAAAPYWQTLNAQVAGYKWNTDITPFLPNRNIDSDEAPYLTSTDAATLTWNADNTDVTAAANGANPISVSGASLTSAQTALGAAAPATLAAAKTALLAAKAANTDQTLINNLSTVFGAYTIGKLRKNAVYNAWGAANNPNSLVGGQAAVHALDVFFAGIPTGARSTRTITADAVKAPAAATITVKIANEFGRKPAGNLTLTLKQAGATVTTQSVAVANDAATFSVAGLAAGTYDYTVSYAGDDQLVAFTDSGTLTVNPGDAVVGDPPVTTTPIVISAPTVKPTITLAKVSKIKGAVSKAPTSRKAGKYKVTFTGASTATGKVTLKLSKGKTTKTITGKLSKGVVTFTVPKLAKGTWKVAISWPGDAKYAAAKASGASIKVTN